MTLITQGTINALSNTSTPSDVQNVIDLMVAAAHSFDEAGAGQVLLERHRSPQYTVGTFTLQPPLKMTGPHTIEDGDIAKFIVPPNIPPLTIFAASMGGKYTADITVQLFLNGKPITAEAVYPDIDSDEVTSMTAFALQITTGDKVSLRGALASGTGTDGAPTVTVWYRSPLAFGPLAVNS